MSQEQTQPVAKYDSEAETRKHIMLVGKLMGVAIADLARRAAVHDHTKLEEPEKSIFDEWTPKLANLTYGSPEYNKMIGDTIGKALEHHYARETHHPEHWPNGIAGMNLLDVLEMFIDWVASSRRQNNGNIRQSITKAQDRFKFPDELKSIFINTIGVFERE